MKNLTLNPLQAHRRLVVLTLGFVLAVFTAQCQQRIFDQENKPATNSIL